MNIEKYTQNAQGAIIDCQNIAVEEGHQQIDGEHLHLALLMQKDGLIPKLLKFMNINTGEVIGAVQQQIQTDAGAGNQQGGQERHSPLK